MQKPFFLSLVLSSLAFTACGIGEVDDPVEKAASVGSFSMSSTDSTDSRMTWNTTNTRLFEIGDSPSLIAEGSGDTRVQINLQSVTSPGNVPVTDDIAVAPGITIVFALDDKHEWVSQSAKSAVVTFGPRDVQLDDVVMEPTFEGGEPFTFDGHWVEKK